MRVSEASAKIQMPVCTSVNPAGGNHVSMKKNAVGIADPIMNGCRRPQRERVESDQRPMTGSATASTSNVSAMATDTMAAGMPMTWL